MSTDITIEETPGSRYAFEDFVRDDLSLVAQAITVVADEPALASEALTAGLQSAFHAWSHIATSDDARQRVFGVAVAHCRSAHVEAMPQTETPQAQHPKPLSDVRVPPAPVDASTEVLRRACVIARHIFSWNASATAVMLDVDHREVVRQLTAANHDALPGHAGDLMRNAVATAGPADFDLDRILNPDPSIRRRKLLRLVVSALVALLGLGALAQCVARPNRLESTQNVQAIESRPLSRPSFPGENVDIEPAPAAAVRSEPSMIEPTLIATDGAGGFVGVRPPSGTDAVAVFSRSLDGQDWRATSTWDLGSPATFSRFERSGEHFAVWIEDPDQPAGTTATQLGISSDLVAWRLLGFDTGDAQAFGLRYRTSISDLAISDDTVLALARTNVEIDFAALSTSESYTCGHSITDDAVTVNLCNSELDVLSLSDVEGLPRRNRLFVSRAGGAFVPTSEPFSRQTDARLTTIDGAFVMTDAVGVRFATSRDPLLWQAIPSDRPPLTVLAAATDDNNQVVGVGTTVDSSLVVFRTSGPTTAATPVNDLIGETAGDIDALVAAGPTSWLIYVFERDSATAGAGAPDARGWILSSTDGLSWESLSTTAPAGNDPRLLPGDSQALVQWTDADEQLVTVSIPLP